MLEHRRIIEAAGCNAVMERLRSWSGSSPGRRTLRDVEVRVLGPLLVVDDHGRAIDLRPMERTLLARLAAGRAAVVSDDILIDALWHRPPKSAHKTLHGLVHHLRRVLGAGAITREPSGYRLILVDLDLDLDLAQRAVDAARAAVDDGRSEEAQRLLRSARERFRAPAFPELEDDATTIGLRRQAAELELGLTEELFGLDIECGRHSEVIGELEVFVARDPTRERAWCLLVRVLAGAGRHADALNAIARARRGLAAELGVDPGPELRELELAVLEHRVQPVPPAPADIRSLPSEARLPGPLTSRSDEVTFIGRRVELGHLERSFRTAIDGGQPRLLIVVGESGIGKTRLAAEFARASHDDGALVLFGRCSEFVSSAFEPLQQALGDLLETNAGAVRDPDTVERIRSLFARLSADSAFDDGRSTPTADRYRLFEEVASVIARLASTRPVLIVLDDVHWASEPTVLSLSHLLRRSTGVRLAIVATARVPEFGGVDIIGALGRESGVSVLRLQGFEVDDVRGYLAVVGDVGGATTAEVLQARTGGNAFMLGELVRSPAVDQFLTNPHVGGTRDTDGSGDVPELVRDVIVARARRLPSPAFDLLQMASVAGLEFDLQLMVDASGLPEKTVVDALDTAIEAQLLVEPASSRPVYAFTHSLARDALRASMSKARRSVIHRQIANALESSAVERTPIVLGRLAYHFLRCSAIDARATGCHYSHLAGERAMAAFAYDDACEWFSDAIEVTRELPGDADLTCRLELGLARAATLSGDEPRARRAAEAAWRAARRSGDRSLEVAAALLYAGEPELNTVGNEPGTVMLAATLDVEGLTGHERALVMARLGSALSYSDHERAVGLALGSLELARAEDDRSALAFAIRCRLRGWFDPDQVDARIAMADELTAIGRELGDGVTESWGLRWQVITRFDRGDTEAIEQECLDLAALGARLHLPNQLWSAAIRLAALRVFQGRFDEAEILIAEASGHAEHIDNMLAVGVTSTVIQTMLWLRGEDVARSSSTEPRFDSGLLWLRDDPSALLDLIAREPDLMLRHDLGRLESICSIALTMRQFSHPAAAAATYPFAERYAHLVAGFAPGAMMYGSMHLYAGLLAGAAGNTGRAIEHLRSAVRANTEMGALPFVALAERELAKLLPDDEEALRARSDSTKLAHRLGVAWLTPEYKRVGTLTFLFTDIEGSTERWNQDERAMSGSLAAHDRTIRSVVESHGGIVFKHTGDGACAVFTSAPAAVTAAIQAQAELRLPVRMGLHTGDAEMRDGDYFGQTLNRASRVMDAGHGGQVLVSSATAALTRDHALIDLGEHHLKGLETPERIFQVGPGAFPALRTRQHKDGNLPVELSTFIGRSREVESLANELADHRLVTLIGTGGTGKTRLAVESATAVSRSYPDGCWIVELAMVTVAETVPFAFASGLGVTVPPERDVIDDVIASARQKRMLVVVDNCEHVLAAAADTIERIVAGCPTVTVLATSREPLMVRGERLVPVPPLSAEDAESLFLTRARDEAPDLVIDTDQVQAVTELCRRLDGLPLALELAASRVRALTPVELVAKLEERFRLLVGGRRSRMERHQTMRGTLDWSYDLCTAAERAVFDRLSVFPAAFDLPAVCSVARGDHVDEFDVVDVLPLLVDRSLLQRSTGADGTSRYRMLETMRAYGREHLQRQGMSDTTRAHHAHYMAATIGALRLSQIGPDELEVTRRLGEYLPDALVALDWCIDHQEWENGLRLTTHGSYVTEHESAEMVFRLHDAARAGGAEPHVLDELEHNDVRLLQTESIQQSVERGWKTIRAQVPVPTDRLVRPPQLDFIAGGLAEGDVGEFLASLDHWISAPPLTRYFAEWCAIRALAHSGHLDHIDDPLSRFTEFVSGLRSDRASRELAELRGVVAAERHDWEAAVHWYSKVADARDGGLRTWLDLAVAWSLITARCLANGPVEITGAELRDPWRCYQDQHLDGLRWRGAVSTALALHRLGRDDLADRFVAWMYRDDSSDVASMFDFELDLAGLPTMKVDRPDDLADLIDELFVVADELDGLRTAAPPAE